MENSAISWTDHTFNPWMGCTKVSPACHHCYAERDMDHRYGKVQWGPSGTRVLTSKANWQKPRKWDREAASEGQRARVFCASLADVFEDWKGGLSGPTDDHGGINNLDQARLNLFNLIAATPNLIWLLLTKRPERIQDVLYRSCGLAWWKENCASRVFFGTSVENQLYADERIPHLLKNRDLCAGTFLSCEPLLGPVKLTTLSRQDFDQAGRPLDRYFFDDCLTGFRAHGGGGWTDETFRVDWIIAGGESGPKARPSHPDWFRSLRDQAVAAGVPFHFKQWGEFAPSVVRLPSSSRSSQRFVPMPGSTSPLDPLLERVGKKKAGRTLDGREWNEFPPAFGVEATA